MTRCTWCEREATRYTGSSWAPPCCDRMACQDASDTAVAAVERWRDRRASTARVTLSHAGQTSVAVEQAERRDARELRGLPTPPAGVTW